MLPRDQRREPDAADEADQVHLHARLVAVAAGEDDAGRRRRVGASSGPTVPSSSAFMSTRCLPASMAASVTWRAELDGAGDVDDDVDAVRRRTTASASSVTTAAPPAPPRARRRGRSSATTARGRPGLGVGAERPAPGGGRRPRRAPSRARVDDLVGQAAAHEAGADHGRPGRGRPSAWRRREQGVDEDHAGASSAPGLPSSGQTASLSRDHRDRQRPGDAERRVVVPEAALGPGVYGSLTW